MTVLTHLCPASALGDARRVVLVEPGIELERAARAALEPWRIELLVASGPAPGAIAPTTHEIARELARTQDAIAVVWTSENDGGHALWVYDRAGEHVVARRLLVAPPFDAASAAAVALSIKTLLRHSETAPAEERYGAGHADPATDTPAELRAAAANETDRRVDPPVAGATSNEDSGRATPTPPLAQPTRAAANLRSRARGRASTPPVDAALAARRSWAPSNVQLDAWGSARFRLTGRGVREARLGLGASWWPRGGTLGISLGGALGPALHINEPKLRGTLSDFGTAVLGRIRRDVAGVIRLGAAAGIAADVTVLEGTATSDSHAPAKIIRVVPAVRLELGADWLITSWVRVGLRAGGCWLLRTQRYLVDAEPVVELSRRSYEAMLTFGASLPVGR